MESKKNIKKSTISIRKLAMAGVLVAVAVAGSLISFPVAGSKCAPVQHMVNICAAVFLGPAWGCRCGILCEYHKKPDRAWKPHGIPRKHGRCAVLWTDVQLQQKNHTYMYRRGARHRHTRRPCSVSSGKIRDAYSAGWHVYIHSAIPYIDRSRKHSGSNCHADS